MTNKYLKKIIIDTYYQINNEYINDHSPYLSFTKQKNSRPIALMKNIHNAKDIKIIFINDGSDLCIQKYKKIVDKRYNFYQIPNTDDFRSIQYISAPSGAGKTTYIKNYIQEYMKVYPKNKIFLYSKKTDDPSIDMIKKIKRIPITDELIENPIDINTLNNACVIFDDVCTLRAKKKKFIFNLIQDIIILGRQNNIECLITSHILCQGIETRDILNEMTSVTIFPLATSYHHIFYCLKNYFGMDKKTINKIFKLNSRWVTLFKNYPQAVLYNHGTYILDNRDYLKD